MSASCPCGSGKELDQCCGRLISGEIEAVSAEQLMRSRYTAYVQGADDYILSTWHPATAPRSIDKDQPVKWVGLKVITTDAGGPDDDKGSVEFVATFKVNGRAEKLHEVSEFVRVSGLWRYVGGLVT